MSRALVLFLLISASAPIARSQSSPAAQQAETRRWHEAYEQGRQQIERQNWLAAAADLEAAKRLRPEQGRRVLFSANRFDAYIPDYYLGLAYMRLGRYQDADEAFRRVASLGLLTQGDRDYGAFLEQAREARFEAALQRADDLAISGDRGRAMEELAAAAAVGGDDARLTAARDRIEATPPPDVDPPGPIVTAENTVPPPLPDGTVPAFPDPSTFDPGGKTDAPRPPPDAPTTPESTTPARPVPIPEPEPESSGGPGSAPAARTERQAIAAFFSGRYEQAAQGLSLLALAPDATPRARFYLACSLAALVITGDRQPSSLANAREHLLRAGSTDQFTYDRRLVSPRILQLLGLRS